MTEYPLEERTIGKILAHKSELHPDRPYLYWKDEVITFGEVELLTNQLAHGMAGAGIERGERVAIMMDNCPEFLWATWALGKIGACVVPINTAAKGQLLGYYLEDAAVTHVIAGLPYAEATREAAKGIEGFRGVVVHDPDSDAQDTLRAMFAAGESRKETPVDYGVEAWDPAYILHTSGTTGPSKGVVCPHAHPLTVGYRVTEAFGITPDDRMYTFLPLFHGNALWYSALTALWAGASIVLRERFSASAFWPDVQKYQVSTFNAIMSVATILEKLPPVPEEQDNPVRLGFIVPLPTDREALEERWGLQFVCNYAMTELLPVTVLKPGEGYGKGDTSGRLASEYIDMKIVDDHDREVPTGEPGEIVVRPLEPWITFTEYFGKPEATAEAFRNAWFHTGDRGRFDEDGYFYFVDRKSDSIRRRGENISAHEIERILETDERVKEAAAVPVPSELGEDDVAVYVARGEETLSEADVIEFAVENMAYYMVPRYVKFVEALPKTPTHKIAKYKVREQAKDEYREIWDREAHGIEVKRPTATQGG